MPEARFHYPGTELDLFAVARNWRAYWTGLVSPFVGRRVLEVGAGIGSTLKALYGPQVERWLALEPDPALAARLRETVDGLASVGVEVRAAGTTQLNAGEIFDTVLYIDVLEHIADDAAEVARVARHVAPRGFLVVLAPAHSFLITAFDAAIGHPRRYEKRTLERRRPAGFETSALRYLDCAGLLASLGNRLLLRKAHPTAAQIAFWDRGLVPLSRRLDPVLGFGLGKSVLAVWRRAGRADAPG